MSVLKLEKEILSNAERRACDEVCSLSERVHRLQVCLESYTQLSSLTIGFHVLIFSNM